MVEVSRRWFMGGALGVAAAAVMPLGAAYDAVLYGDGIHDDTAALQALFDGRPVYVKNDGVVLKSNDGHISLKGGNYKISETLNIAPGKTIQLAGLHIDCKNLPEGRCLFWFNRHLSCHYPTHSG